MLLRGNVGLHIAINLWPFAKEVADIADEIHTKKEYK